TAVTSSMLPFGSSMFQGKPKNLGVKRKDFHRHFHLEGRRWRGGTGKHDFDLAFRTATKIPSRSPLPTQNHLTAENLGGYDAFEITKLVNNGVWDGHGCFPQVGKLRAAAYCACFAVGSGSTFRHAV
ncbi:MAG: hypothetical protein WBE55_13860, partial [Candidatus Sulfotelmatobacter sp.]